MNIIIILSNGKSIRMNYKKENLFIKGNILIKYYVNYIIKNIKNKKLYVNTNTKIYNNIPDIIKNIGPIGALYTIKKFFLTQNLYKKINTILLISIDNPIISNKTIKLLYSWKKKYEIIMYNKINFFNIIQINNKILKKNIQIKKKKSLIEIMKISKKKIINNKIRKNLLININNKKTWMIIKNILESKNEFNFKK